MAENNQSYKSIAADKFRPATQHDHVAEREQIAGESLNFLQDSWRRLKKNKVAIVSLVVLIVVVILAILAPVIAPADPNAQNVAFANLPPKIPGLENFAWFDGKSEVAGTAIDQYAANNVPEDVYYYLGTDALGRDLLSRVLYGTRVSLFIGMMAALFNLVIGVPYGIISGWNGGRIDNIMMRLLEILSGVPNLVIVILMLLVLQPGIMSIIIALAITEWISMARVIRAQTMKIKSQEYILAARSLGESAWKISFRHILPNLSGIIIIQTVFSIPSAIFFEAFLSFIGLGIPAPNASLGTLINDGYKTFRFLPHLMWYPAGVICIVMIAFNMLANGLRDALDPKTND